MAESKRKTISKKTRFEDLKDIFRTSRHWTELRENLRDYYGEDI